MLGEDRLKSLEWPQIDECDVFGVGGVALRLLHPTRYPHIDDRNIFDDGEAAQRNSTIGQSRYEDAWRRSTQVSGMPANR